MVTKAQRAASEALNPESELEELPVPDDIAVANLLAELGQQGVMVRIYRQGLAGARDLTLIDEMPVEQFNPIQLAYPPYDGGTFRIHARSESGIVANRELKVQRKLSVPVVAPAVPSGLTKAEVVELLNDRFELLLARFPQAPAPIDPFANIEKIASLIKLMTPAPPAAVAAVAPQPTLMEQLATLKLVKEFVGDQGGEGDDGIGKTLLKEGVGMVSEMVKAAQAQQRQHQGGAPAAQAAPQLPNPASTAATVRMDPAYIPPEVLQGAEDDEMKLMWSMALRKACRDAAAGVDAAEFAEKWYDDVPDDVMSDLQNNPEWFAEVCKIHADCEVHREWFTTLRDTWVFWETEELDTAGENVQAVPSNGDTQSTNGDTDAQPGPGDTPTAP